MSTRRRFLAGVAAAGALATPALAQGSREWIMVTAWPKDLAGPGESARRIAERISEMSDGKLRVKLYAGGELLPTLDNMSKLVSGEVDMVHDMASYHLDQSTALSFFASVPFGLIAQEHMAWLGSEGQGLWDELSRRLGVRSFAAGIAGNRLGGWFMKEVDSVADLKGLKIRISGFAGQALERLGAVQTMVPGSQIAGQLKSGELDAAYFMGPVNDIDYGIEDVAKLLYWPGFVEPSAALQLMVNAKAFNGLPKAHQAVIAAACGEETMRASAAYGVAAPAVIEKLMRTNGVTLKQFPDDVFTALGKETGAVLGNLLQDPDELTRRIATSYLRFRSQTRLWTRIGDQAYANMRLLEYPFPNGA